MNVLGNSKTSASVQALLGISEGRVIDAAFMVATGKCDADCVFDLLSKPGEAGLDEAEINQAFDMADKVLARFIASGVSLTLRLVYVNAFHQELRRRTAFAHGRELADVEG